jgi:hypothetical protein
LVVGRNLNLPVVLRGPGREFSLKGFEQPVTLFAA